MMGAGKMLALNVGNSVTALKEKKRRGTYINWYTPSDTLKTIPRIDMVGQ